jgi:hypothetical protein
MTGAIPLVVDETARFMTKRLEVVGGWKGVLEQPPAT